MIGMTTEAHPSRNSKSAFAFLPEPPLGKFVAHQRMIGMTTEAHPSRNSQSAGAPRRPNAKGQLPPPPPPSASRMEPTHLFTISVTDDKRCSTKSHASPPPFSSPAHRRAASPPPF